MNLEIEKDQVHVWQVHLNSTSSHPMEITKALSSDELEQANKFKFPEDREHFILRRNQLRTILSKYYGCQPREIIFRYNSYKKPFIYMPELKRIKFNMSFSGDLMLVGISKHNDIGIDIEKVHEMHDLENIAFENFSSQELKYLNGTLDITNTFFKIWTRKEAFIKAKGEGIYHPLKSFCVDIKSSGSYEQLVIFNHPAESKLWRTTEINTSSGYIASMAINSHRFQILYFQLQ